MQMQREGEGGNEPGTSVQKGRGGWFVAHPSIICPLNSRARCKSVLETFFGLPRTIEVVIIKCMKLYRKSTPGECV